MKIPLSSSKNSFISIESHEKSATKGEKSLSLREKNQQQKQHD